jgi:predicted RNA-binding Zn-ribbon protein involved in translation (DUF1610 family)
MKSLDLFHVDNSRKDGRSYKCVDCKNARDRETFKIRSQNLEWKKNRNKQKREWIKNNPEAKRSAADRYKRWRANQLESWKGWTVERGYGYCIVCRAPDPEFHHMIPEEKESTMSDLFKKTFNDENKEIVLIELKKTEPLCNSCHKEIHRRTMAIYGLPVLEEMIQERAR